jgi:hypothetical protein
MRFEPRLDPPPRIDGVVVEALKARSRRALRVADPDRQPTVSADQVKPDVSDGQDGRVASVVILKGDRSDIGSVLRHARSSVRVERGHVRSHPDGTHPARGFRREPYPAGRIRTHRVVALLEPEQSHHRQPAIGSGQLFHPGCPPGQDLPLIRGRHGPCNCRPLPENDTGVICSPAPVNQPVGPRPQASPHHGPPHSSPPLGPPMIEPMGNSTEAQ